MAIDATFEKIQNIVPHDNADSLEIAVVSNFPCVVRKGEFKINDNVFYIRDDAKLLASDRKDDSDHWPWQNNLLKYLGSGGRVKTVKLRGKVSMGILMRPDKVLNLSAAEISDESLIELNKKIKDAVTGAAFLEKTFGVAHWIPPAAGFGSLNVKYSGLPEGLQKSDQENYENLGDEDLHLGSRALITKKLDGTSTTVTCYPDGRYEISSRSQTFNIESMLENGEENIYTKYTKEAVKGGIWYAKTFNKVIALRGEICCNSVQRSSYNKDCCLEDFFIYGCEFPFEEDWKNSRGLYGTENHFLKIVGLINDNGFNLKTVPIVGEEVLTKELLRKYNDMDWTWGEGVVFNIYCPQSEKLDSHIWNYKSKSRSYLMKMK